MEFYSIHVDDSDISGDVREVFAESVILDEFSIEELDDYYLEDLAD